MTSRLKGVASTMSKSVRAELYMLKPSWCLAMGMTYFIPAFLAKAAQAVASNLTGLNSAASFGYSATGIFSSNMIHSA